MKRKLIQFTDCLKTFTVDQDKAITPEETLERFYKQVKSLKVNILNEVKRIDNGRLDIPVYFSVCGDAASALTGTKKQMGKGASPIQAEASACMELAERFSFFSFKNNDSNFLVGDYKTMRGQGYPVLDTRYLLQSVHDDKNSPELLEKLLDGLTMQWVWGTNVTRNEEVLIPFSWFFAINEFNGPSAGNTLEEAALQGVCEIVERHVCSLVSHDKRVTPRINLDSVEGDVAKEVIDKFRKHDIDLYLNDFSLDTGIPTIGALAIDRSTFPETSEIVYTAGTTPDPEKALIRAVTEVAQLAGDFNSGSNYIASGLPKPLAMKEVEYLTEGSASLDINTIPNLVDNNIKIEVENCVRSLQKIGLEVLMVDVTHPELDIPALYTIVPGAHFRERSRINDVGLFCAKLTVEIADDPFELADRLEAMEKLLPGVYYIEFYRGRNSLGIGQIDEAIEHFQKALTLSPEDEDLPYIYSYLGSCLKDLERYDEAIVVLKKGLAEDDERPDMHNFLGVCYFKKEAYSKAIDHFKRAVELNPASAIDYANIGVNYNRLGEKKMAIEFLTVALTLDPELDFAQNLLDSLMEK